MDIHYLMLEAKPCRDNPEREQLEGAYVNCWVNADDGDAAYSKATAYLLDEGWEVVKMEERFIAKRQLYERDAEFFESLACFDHAVKNGIAAIIRTWPYSSLQ